jgi:spermidine/putrescine transport system substrate-binding protein
MEKYFTRSSRFIIGSLLVWSFFFFGLFLAIKWLQEYSLRGTLRICAWGDIFDEKMIHDFEKEYGVSVVINTYASNEELITKLGMNYGKGYDLIVPSDYAITLLKERDLLKKLDHNQIRDCIAMIEPGLLHRDYDKDHEYSIPIFWELFGLGIDREYCIQHRIDNLEKRGWGLVLEKPVIPYKVVMTNDPLGATMFGLAWWFAMTEHPTEEQIAHITEHLKEQRSWVKAYTDTRPDYFLITRLCPVVIASSSYIMRSIRAYSYIDFVIPDQGRLMTIENIAIPSGVVEEALAYKFISFLYRPQVMQYAYEKLGMFPAVAYSLLYGNLVADRPRTIWQQAVRLLPVSKTFFDVISSRSLFNLWAHVKC